MDGAALRPQALPRPPGPPRGHPPPLRWGDRRGLRIPKSLWRGPRQGGRGRRPAGEKHQTKREKNRHTKWGKNTSKRNFPTRCFPEAFAHQSVSAASDLCPRTVVVTAGQAPGRHRELGEGHQLQRRAGLQGDLAPVERGVLCVRLHVEVPNDGQGGGHCWQGSTCRRHCGSSDLRPPVLSGSLQKELWLSEPGKYLQDGVSLICGVVRKRKENIQAHHNGKCTGKKKRTKNGHALAKTGRHWGNKCSWTFANPPKTSKNAVFGLLISEAVRAPDRPQAQGQCSPLMHKKPRPTWTAPLVAGRLLNVRELAPREARSILRPLAHRASPWVGRELAGLSPKWPGKLQAWGPTDRGRATR